MAVFNPQQLQQLQEQAKRTCGYFSKAQLSELQSQLNCSLDSLLKALLPVAASFSQAPISHFNVGAVAYDEITQSAYLGANLEFSHQALSLVVHAEQSAINNAWLNGAKEISFIAITDAPCGYCRQFMNELSTSKRLSIMLPTLDTKLTELLPSSFGPQELDNPERLLASNIVAIKSFSSDISSKLQSHLQHAYAPYSKNFAAVEICTQTHGVFYGRYAENAAYNPSLSPMQSALSQLALAGLTIEHANVVEVTLVQSEGFENQQAVTEAVLASYNANIKPKYVTAKLA
ncbi:Cytidine deaminase [Pseudoalteromonas holothuriae]|uniref:Cytidine deaminase n=1 Tax=Pseudoalteromonas holothuriae TaxID=2963714 RepID=A0A9W4VSQ1_9GAMM|nr:MULTISPECIES: cytidine deaminase [unclassified Pseudoalteromonas]CAH9050718.1 Cytidine deaminase [Pseudoalteromonas sp. CIP111951]CAH9061356.1 Cytidine deaminase [Pseudoalteromonas sp. CIP111854]